MNSAPYPNDDNDLSQDEVILSEVSEAIQDALRLFEVSAENPPDNSIWPYICSPNPVVRPQRRLSQSTTSMIAAAILAAKYGPHMRSANSYHPVLRPRISEPGVSNGLSAIVSKAQIELAKAWIDSALGKDSVQEKEANCSFSKTFGKNDALTISWYIDLFNDECPHGVVGLDAARRTDVLTTIDKSISEKIHKINNAGGVQNLSGLALSDRDKKFDEKTIFCDSAYSLLRIVRTVLGWNRYKVEGADLKLFRETSYRFFLSRTQLHLAHLDVRDGQFDLSELVYCLEGLFLTNPEMITEELVVKILDVVFENKEHLPTWRSRVPIVANQKGMALYPISVETATSLICTLSWLERQPYGIRVLTNSGHKYLAVIRKYWAWLRARRQTISTADNKSLRGWKSEHIDQDIIHTWETSQVLEFLVIFYDFLHRSVSERMLENSELKITRSKISVPNRTATTAIWQKYIDEREPLLEADRDQQKLHEIGRDFLGLGDENQNSDPFKSMLLFGPPGTGKTTIAEKIAEALGAPLVTVTVSDFLAAGVERMEARAKYLFKVIDRQHGAVIFFDEMDQFILDRDSKLFRDQESAFQFLTPGMLTKFADLRKAARVHFIVATNYEERIDAAIKRSGRIDKRYLILPPNSKRRIEMLLSLTKSSGLKPEEVEDLGGASVFLGHTDMKNAVKTWLSAPSSEQTFSKLSATLAAVPRSISFRGYAQRLSERGGAIGQSELGLASEICGLVMLAVEVANSDGASDLIRELKDSFAQEKNDLTDHVVRLYGEKYRAAATRVLK